MKDDDPEKRIRELEQELADVSRTPQSPPQYTESTTYTEGSTYTAGPTYTAGQAYTGGPSYGGPAPYSFNMPQGRRRSYPWFLVLVILGVVIPIAISLIMFFARSTTTSSFSRGSGFRTTTAGPTAVPQGGELRVSGTNETRTIACNDGQLTVAGTNSKYTLTGHCAGVTIGGYYNNVTVDSADTIESTGYSNTVVDKGCNNGAVKVSSYSNDFTITGHCASLAISSYNTKVVLDSVDSVIVSGYNNNVTYHSGTPRVTDSGSNNNIQKG